MIRAIFGTKTKNKKGDFRMTEISRLKTIVRVYEKEYIYDKLEIYNWNKPKTAEVLGIGLSSLYRKMKELKQERRF